jgi:NAD(P)-dependent dehydrogenase (short-subunit alcohol dehydrogenase family)
LRVCVSKMTTHAEFGRETKAIEVAEAFTDGIRGKTGILGQVVDEGRLANDPLVVVVGVSPKSIGEAMVTALAAHEPATLVLASRTKAKMEAVAYGVQQRYRKVRLEMVQLDLSSMQSVRAGAKAINELLDHIDILINNAAIVVTKHEFTIDGLEMQFGTNHIGPFLLTNLLMPKILAAARKAPTGATRIVNVTSDGHVISPIRFSDHRFEKRPENIPEDERPISRDGVSFDPPPGETYVPFVAYGQSKTANVLMSVYVNLKLSDFGILSMATHPGSIWTDLSRHLDEKHSNMIKNTSSFWKDLDQGAATTLVAAFDHKLNDQRSVYMADCQFKDAAAWAIDVVAAERLWKLSEEIVGEEFDWAVQSSRL